MTVDHVLRAGLIFGGFLVIRAIAKWRVDQRKQSSFVTPLVDPVKLETLLVAQPGEDANLIAELRDTIAHLNREAYAEEFYGLDRQIAALDHDLPAVARNTLRAEMLRLLDSDERWLQLVAAKTCARLNVTDALPRLEAIHAGTDESGGGARFKSEVGKAIDELKDAVGA
jgi:hypothetical protein